ncbi:MAG: LemA family protein [Halioglobus sp.]
MLAYAGKCNFQFALAAAYTQRVIESLIVFALLLGGSLWIYNRLVADRNQVQAAWSDIDVQLKRRHELVPGLVSMVKAYADYEKGTLTAVTELRRQSRETSRLPAKAALEHTLEDSLHRLVVLAENYPELKADENFRQLQHELTDTEDQIQYARRFYNGAVRAYNTRIQSFPHLLLARPLGFAPADFFQIDRDAERRAPDVALG